jgi:hypothetical protein
MNCDSGFIDHDLNNLDRFSSNRAASVSAAESNDPIELTFYIPILTSNTLIPFKIRTNRLTTSQDLLQIVVKQQHILIKSISSLASSSLVFIWIRSNGREQVLEENLTANEIEKRLMRYGGQIHVRSRGLSISRSSQPLTKIPSTSRLSPTTQTTSSSNSSNTNVPGSNLSLNI